MNQQVQSVCKGNLVWDYPRSYMACVAEDIIQKADCGDTCGFMNGKSISLRDLIILRIKIQNKRYSTIKNFSKRYTKKM
jgi:hypothetical protein